MSIDDEPTPPSPNTEIAVFERIARALQSLPDDDARTRVLRACAILFDIDTGCPRCDR